MKIEKGKCYSTRDGRKVGPMKYCGLIDEWPFRCGTRTYTRNGIWKSDFTESKNDLIAEWHDTLRTWAEMTDAEKGALLLAEHEGKVIEVRRKTSDWTKISCPTWNDTDAYRIRPEPKRETAELYGSRHYYSPISSPERDTHRITFDLIDGEPDCEKCPTCGTSKHVDMEPLE